MWCLNLLGLILGQNKSLNGKQKDFRVYEFVYDWQVAIGYMLAETLWIKAIVNSNKFENLNFYFVLPFQVQSLALFPMQ